MVTPELMRKLHAIWDGPHPRVLLGLVPFVLERTLLHNDGKEDWRGLDYQQLLDLLDEDEAELKRELLVPLEQVSLTRVALEALDVMAVTLFIWSKAEGVGADRGRALG
jgi:hypothetical protein